MWAHILLIAAIMLTPTMTHAAQEAWIFRELPYTRCITLDDLETNKNCYPLNRSSDHWGQRAKIELSLFTFPAHSEVTIAQCIDTGEDTDGDGTADTICTTGNSTLDKEIFCGDANSPDAGCDHLTYLKNMDKVYYMQDGPGGYGQFYIQNGIEQKVTPAKIPTDAAGKTTIPLMEWQSYTQYLTRRSFYAIYPLPVEITPTATHTPTPPLSALPTTQITQIVRGGGQQQDTLSFPSSTPIPTNTPIATATPQVTPSTTPLPTPPIVRAAWDPRGRIFDMASLEPVGQGKITLKQKRPDNIFDAGYATQENLLILNPFPVDNSGIYIFYVVKGEYTLQPQFVGYRHPTTREITSMHPNAKKIYTSELYMADSPAIIEAGTIEYRDLPMQRISGEQTESDILIYSEHRMSDADGNLVYSGAVSYPYAELHIKTCLNGESGELCKENRIFDYSTGGPDNEGEFTVHLDQRQLESGEYYVRSFKKVDLRTLPLSRRIPSFWHTISKMFLQQFTVYAVDANPDRGVIQPIPAYIEGIAYNRQGDTYENTTIHLHKPGVQKPVYTTQTGSDGFFRILSDYIPRETYTIRIADTNIQDEISTSRFLAQNAAYIEGEKIDPYTQIVSTNDTRAEIGRRFPADVSATPRAEAPPEVAVSNSVTGQIVLILIFVTVCAGGVGFLIYKKYKEKKSES